jgi:hypothetical protein
VKLVEADVAGLAALADLCDAAASRVESWNVPLVGAPNFQASAMAMQAAHADIASASARFATQLRATAAAVARAAEGYVETDTSNAVVIAAVSTNGATVV